MALGRYMAGCAAALKTESGKIGYVGPLIDPETIRLTSSVYLGAQYCADTYRDDLSAEDIDFAVTWIGFWFNIPGVTLDPTEVSNAFLDEERDVLISGIDTASLIEQLIALESRGKLSIQARVNSLQTQKAAMLDINSGHPVTPR